VRRARIVLFFHCAFASDLIHAMQHRRQFFRSAAAVSASLFAATARGSVSPDSVLGKSKWDLETPALCVDLDKLERNLRAVHSKLAGTGVGVRPHIKTHKCPALARMQMDTGAIGVCAAKLSESEVMLENGISNVLMTGVNVTASKILRAMELRKKHPGFVQAVDNEVNAADLDEAARAAGVVADVVVDIEVFKRSGALPGEPALRLAQQVDRARNLNFRGILAYDGPSQHVHGHAARKAATLRAMEPVVETYEMMKAAGLNLEIFSGAGTGTYDMMSGIPGFTDVQAGSYLFMDCQYMDIGSQGNESVYDDFEPSLTVLATIINANHPSEKLVTDAGSKALTLNKPAARVIGEPGFDYNANSDEYGVIAVQNPSREFKVGEVLEVIVPHCDPVVNLYDVMFGIRRDRVEAVLPVLARGKSQ
jgi:D-serine deaminase-like pyridoxal phosphate-dependent protein